MTKGLIYLCDRQPETRDQLARTLASDGYATEIFPTWSDWSEPTTPD